MPAKKKNENEDNRDPGIVKLLEKNSTALKVEIYDSIQGINQDDKELYLNELKRCELDEERGKKRKRIIQYIEDALAGKEIERPDLDKYSDSTALEHVMAREIARGCIQGRRFVMSLGNKDHDITFEPTRKGTWQGTGWERLALSRAKEACSKITEKAIVLRNPGGRELETEKQLYFHPDIEMCRKLLGV
jgi:hypothetical protein